MDILEEELRRHAIRPECIYCIYASSLQDPNWVQCRKNPPIVDKNWPTVPTNNWCGEFFNPEVGNYKQAHGWEDK